ncbi:MAG: LysM peptidoglycan-binding domain-containing protein [Bdellovibrionaceae bacterium]|nr:LysM peptidoglycan-binding domain-containing protein [Pseudobdellovibrionaceae bacterium]
MKSFILILYIFIILFAGQIFASSKTHVIKKGESLMTISNIYYGTHQKWRLITKANPKIDPNKIEEGTTLTIPEVVPFINSKAPGIVARNNKKSPSTSTKTNKKVIDSVVNKKKHSLKEVKKLSNKNIENEKLIKASKKLIAEKERLNKELLEAEKKLSRKKIYIQKIKDKRIKELNKKNEAENKQTKTLLLKVNKLEKELSQAKSYKSSADKYLNLEKLYLKLQAENQELKEELISNKEVTSLKNKFKSSLKMAKSKLAQCQAKANDLSLEQIQTYASIANSQSQILKEKHRILSQRYWLIKNSMPEQCKLSFAPKESYKIKEFNEFIEQITEILGPKHVFVEPGANKVMFQFPKNTIYGVDEPKVSSKFLKAFTKISDFSRQYNVDKIELTGHTSYKQVTSVKTGKKYDGSVFVLNQLLSLKDYLEQEHALSPMLFEVNSFGENKNAFRNAKGYQKRFEVTLKFKPQNQPKRELASVKKDPVLKNLGSELLEYLGEPKYSSVKLSKGGLEIHLGRHYFWKTSSDKLKMDGKEKISKIFEILSKADDSHVRLYWVPGLKPKSNEKNRTLALKQLSELKKYLIDDLAISKKSIVISYLPHHNKLVEKYKEKAFKYNDRIVFKLVPNSVTIRNFGRMQ